MVSNLEEKGVIKGGFLRSTKLQSVSPELFTMSIDLRSETQIHISAPELSIGKIRKVVLYPSFYRDGEDYEIAIDEDKQNATVTIKDVKKFMSERVVISID